MSRPELESTIVEPARMVGLRFDPPQLVSQILDEVGNDEGILPLLQFALRETWMRREGTVMTAESYVRSGGVREAIRLTAERTFEDLSPEDQLAARRLFLRLVTPGEGQEDTGARATMPVDPALRRIVDIFASPRVRLLTVGLDNAGVPTIEVAHGSLIRTWPRLRVWVDANREKLHARAVILKAKAEWEQNGRRDDLLLPGGFALERARALAADPGDLAIDDIKEFIVESEAADEGRRAGEIEAAKAIAVASQRVARRTLAGLGAASVLLLIAIGMGAYARFQATEAATNFHSAQIAESQLRAAQAKTAGADAVTAALIALEGLPDSTSPDEAQRTRPLVNAAWKALYAAYFDLYERVILSGHTGPVTSAVFAPDGSRILTAAEDNTARLWDRDGKPLAILRGHTGPVTSAVFAPDGGRILTAAEDNTARLWDRDGKPLAILEHTGPVNSAVFASDGGRLLTASQDKTARLWDRDGKQLAVLEGHTAGVNDAVFAPDGSGILTASQDKTARLWDRDGKLLAILEDRTGPVTRAMFAPDGGRVLTAAEDNTARLWDRDGKELAILKGHTGPVTSAVFAPDGGRVLTAAEDNTARLWDRDGKPLAILEHTGPVTSAVFAPDGRRVLTASQDKTARLWDKDGKQLVILGGHIAGVNEAVFAPDGRLVLTASADNTARVWDAPETQASVDRVKAEEALPKTQALVDRVKAKVPRCLTPQQRQNFGLVETPPHWCAAMHKWPYLTPLDRLPRSLFE
jgi:WD40 repeat protein